MSPQQMAALNEQHSKQQRSIIAATVQALTVIWAGFGGWHDPDLIAGRAAASASQIDAATTLVRRASQSYLQNVLTAMRAAPKTMPALQLMYPRANITPFEVYQRPATQYVKSAIAGHSSIEAAAEAMARLQTVATTDLRAADRDETSHVYAKAPKVIGYRRILHPELSKSGSCGLCVVASHRIYHSDELLPLHFPSCECSTMPIVKGQDPGAQINDDDLQTIYAAAGGTQASDLIKTRIRFSDHGEMGPVLVREGDKFTTPKDLGLPEFRKPDAERARELGLREIEQLRTSFESASTRFDEFMTAHPRASWSSADQQDAYALQRAYLDIAARQRQLQARWR